MIDIAIIKEKLLKQREVHLEVNFLNESNVIKIECANIYNEGIVNYQKCIEKIIR